MDSSCVRVHDWLLRQCTSASGTLTTRSLRMKVFFLLAFALTASASLAEATVQRYDEYKVYSVVAKDARSLDALRQLQMTTLVFDFWTEPAMNRPTDIMAPPGHSGELLRLLDDFQMSYKIKMEDVQKVIDASYDGITIPQTPRHPRSSARYDHNWSTYSRLNTIHAFMNELAATFPNLVTVSSLGKSFEGRDLLMMKVSTGSSPTKNSIFIDGGIHAREWISPATVTYIMSELIENNAAHTELTDKLDWYFVPVVNPDGYEYSHTTSRLWRKNRNPNQGNCVGTDNNRNFGYHWAEGGTSNNGCSEIYHGASAFSELESQHIRDAVAVAAAARAKCYLTFHSYGQDMLTPWSYDNSPLPDNFQDMYNLGIQATTALTAVYGTRYSVANSFQLYGATAGSSDDWAKGGANIPFAYTVELRDEGQYGFVLPESQILPTGVETWELVNVVAKAVINMQ